MRELRTVLHPWGGAGTVRRGKNVYNYGKERSYIKMAVNGLILY